MLGAAGCVPYARARIRRRPMGVRGRYLYLLPMALFGDLVEIAVLARSSIRYRTLVL